AAGVARRITQYVFIELIQREVLERIERLLRARHIEYHAARRERLPIGVLQLRKRLIEQAVRDVAIQAYQCVFDFVQACRSNRDCAREAAHTKLKDFHLPYRRNDKRLTRFEQRDAACARYLSEYDVTLLHHRRG